MLHDDCRRSTGGAPDPGQQIHGAQHRGAGAAVGPAGPAVHAHAAQPGAADTGQKPLGYALLSFI